MKIVSDLHIHSRYAQACSKNINLDNLEKYAKIKGLNLLGTGDFAHPKWNAELKKELKEDDTGILKTKSGFPFLLQMEISNIFTQGGKGRRVHNILFARSFDVVDQIIEALLKRGRLDYDGRPIFGFSCIELVEIMKGIDKDIEIIPAHAWTPWFSVFGSKSGFDSLEECFQEQTKHIHAIETGLSSDPPMNHRLSQLDNINLVSFSDSHSYWPWRIGREATVFDLKELTYDNILNSVRTGKGIAETIEVEPSYGKYHIDGHRNCNVFMEPSESAKHDKICPVCKTKMTIGVLNRVEELADRPEGFKLENRPGYKSLLPLTEIIAAVHGINQLASQKVWDRYNKLIERFGSEMSVLTEIERRHLDEVVDKKLSDAIVNLREGKIEIQAGYDGVYGKAIFSEKDRIKPVTVTKTQKSLSDFN